MWLTSATIQIRSARTWAFTNISTIIPTKAQAEGECFIGSSAYIAIMEGMDGLLLFYN